MSSIVIFYKYFAVMSKSSSFQDQNSIDPALLQEAYNKLLCSEVFSGEEFSKEFLEAQFANKKGGLSVISILPGETIILEWDSDCSSFYIFVRWKFSVFVGNKRIAETNMGMEVIGEVGFIDPDNKRIATVIAEWELWTNERNVMIRIDQSFIEKTLHTYPLKQLRIYRNLAREMAEKLDATNKLIHTVKNDKEHVLLLRKLFERSAKRDISWEYCTGNLCEFLRSWSEVFRDIDTETLGRIIIGDKENRPRFVYLQNKELLLSPTDEKHDRFFVVLSGWLDVYDEEKLIWVIWPLGVVGEVSFMNPDLGRIATVSATDFSKNSKSFPVEWSKWTILLELEQQYINRLDVHHQIVIYRNLARWVGKKLSRMNAMFKRIHELVENDPQCDSIRDIVSWEIGKLI